MTPFEEETLVQVAASRLAQRSMMAVLLLALGEANALDIERALCFVDTLAAAYRQPVNVASDVSIRAMKLAAEEMAELRPTIINMQTMPPGAGTA